LPRKRQDSVANPVNPLLGNPLSLWGYIPPTLIMVDPIPLYISSLEKVAQDMRTFKLTPRASCQLLFSMLDANLGFGVHGNSILGKLI
jgi:hypothetical protein